MAVNVSERSTLKNALSGASKSLKRMQVPRSSVPPDFRCRLTPGRPSAWARLAGRCQLAPGDGSSKSAKRLTRCRTWMTRPSSFDQGDQNSLGRVEPDFECRLIMPQRCGKSPRRTSAAVDIRPWSIPRTLSDARSARATSPMTDKCLQAIGATMGL